jgi:hypothetical protein
MLNGNDERVAPTAQKMFWLIFLPTSYPDGVRPKDLDKRSIIPQSAFNYLFCSASEFPLRKTLLR